MENGFRKSWGSAFILLFLSLPSEEWTYIRCFISAVSHNYLDESLWKSFWSLLPHWLKWVDVGLTPLNDMSMKTPQALKWAIVRLSLVSVCLAHVKLKLVSVCLAHARLRLVSVCLAHVRLRLVSECLAHARLRLVSVCLAHVRLRLVSVC